MTSSVESAILYLIILADLMAITFSATSTWNVVLLDIYEYSNPAFLNLLLVVSLRRKKYVPTPPLPS